jgi:hypothetical protein
MTEHDTRLLIEKLAPLDDTPAGLARHLAAQAFAAQARMFDHPYMSGPPQKGRTPEFLDWMRRLDQTVATFRAAFLARKLAELDPKVAAEAAVVMRDALNSGDGAYEWVGGWVEEDGVDAEAIVQAVRVEQTAVTA